MDISGITSIINAGLITQSSGQNAVKQRGQEFQDLYAALQSGDISGANQAYTALQQLMPGLGTAGQVQPIQSDSNNSADTDLRAVGSALQSGDLKAAKDAFTKLQQDMASLNKGSRHHHHHHHGMAAASAQNTAANSDVNSNNIFSADLTALGGALQAGDLKSAQNAFAKVLQDVQSAGQGYFGYSRYQNAAGMQAVSSSGASGSINVSV